jgi:hypothetical protein
MMNPAPKIVGGAAVVLYSPIDERHRPTGECRQIVAGVLQGTAAGLAICQYQGEDGYFLFGCGEDWQSITDSWHSTAKEAMNQAEFEYDGVRKTWLNHEPAWEELADGDRTVVWELFYEKFRFNPSTKSSEWPGIKEPMDSITFDISHFLDGSEQARTTDENGLNAEIVEIFRQCVLPGEKLYALDWQHPCYWFNPFGRFEFSPMYAGMIPVIPNGDYHIFLADDFRFGTFGHPWEQTICVFGDELLGVVMREHPTLLQRTIRRDGRAL